MASQYRPLAPDWILMPAIDRELKEYILLAFLQQVRMRFAERKLYPYLDELQQHLMRLDSLRREKELLSEALQRPLLGMDLREGRLQKAPMDQPIEMDVIDQVIDLALPELRRSLEEGRELREALSARIRFGPLGLLPLSPREGYLFLRREREARVYAYAMPLLREAAEELQYRSVNTHYLATYRLSLSNSYERIRAELISSRSELPTPATFVFETDMDMPHIETFMPLAKQLVYEQIGPKPR